MEKNIIKYLNQTISEAELEQLIDWLKQNGATESPINFVPSRDIISFGKVRGPFEGELFERIKSLQLKA